jgi:hypothetical protein
MSPLHTFLSTGGDETLGGSLDFCTSPIVIKVVVQIVKPQKKRMDMMPMNLSMVSNHQI